MAAKQAEEPCKGGKRNHIEFASDTTPCGGVTGSVISVMGELSGALAPFLVTLLSMLTVRFGQEITTMKKFFDPSTGCGAIVLGVVSNTIFTHALTL